MKNRRTNFKQIVSANKLMSMLKSKCLVLYLIASFFLVACVSKEKKENQITLFAAASLTDVISEIAQEYTLKTNVEVRLNFASSGILARQIENGAGFDCYVSASKNWIDYLDSLAFVASNSKKSIAGNRLVAIVPKDSKIGEQDSVSMNQFPALFKGRLSMGDPLHVPAGMYANQIIKKHLWQQNLNKRILPAKNVRDALFMVEMGEAEMGIVYFSDAKKSTKVKLIFEFRKEDCDPIKYYAGTKMKKDKKTDDFMAFLNGNRASLLWKRNGFTVN